MQGAWHDDNGIRSRRDGRCDFTRANNPDGCQGNSAAYADCLGWNLKGLFLTREGTFEISELNVNSDRLSYLTRERGDNEETEDWSLACATTWNDTVT